MRLSSFRLQVCYVTVGVTGWTECSRLSHLFQATDRRSTDPRVSLKPHERRSKNEEEDDDEDDDDSDDDDVG